MSAAEMVDRFMRSLRTSREPELQMVAAMVSPQLGMMGDKSGVVVLLDQAAEMWAAARGARYEIEAPA